MRLQALHVLVAYRISIFFFIAEHRELLHIDGKKHIAEQMTWPFPMSFTT